MDSWFWCYSYCLEPLDKFGKGNKIYSKVLSPPISRIFIFSFRHFLHTLENTFTLWKIHLREQKVINWRHIVSLKFKSFMSSILSVKYFQRNRKIVWMLFCWWLLLSFSSSSANTLSFFYPGNSLNTTVIFVPEWMQTNRFEFSLLHCTIKTFYSYQFVFKYQCYVMDSWTSYFVYILVDTKHDITAFHSLFVYISCSSGCSLVWFIRIFGGEGAWWCFNDNLIRRKSYHYSASFIVI